MSVSYGPTSGNAEDLSKLKTNKNKILRNDWDKKNLKKQQ